ncbi:caspase family protein [Sulfitobacter sp. SK011]|uniref:caspase family protein n=1 Tax=Sulfitobacter sp. SK011 TaxID=1389004 RepID=UPI000E0B3473|nr:caspase family protein [Sulfitobacter sp. SK011]AXI41344.1 hypothetical protein C1J02_04750 [Sulfitobacter sp. SK011]
MLRALIILMSMTFASSALAERRVALVIGNSDYQHAARLPNPQNDARAIGDKLSQIGFEVFLHENLGGQQFRVALGAFSEEALRADLAVVFYAGHGIEMGGQNYLIPIDAMMTSEATAQFEAVSLNGVLTTVRNAGKLGLVMLDACRDNPFANTIERKNGTRAISRGLAPISLEGEAGTLVSFAAQAGDTADDGDGMHSPYTEALLELLAEPGLEVGALFQRVTKVVKDKTEGRQKPMYRIQPPEDLVYLVPQGVAVPAVAAPEAPATYQEDAFVAYLDAVQSQKTAPLRDFIARYPAHANAPDARRLLLSIADREFWETTKEQNTVNAYNSYIAAFSNGQFTNEAKSRKRAIEIAAAPKQKPAPAPSIVRPSFDCARASTVTENAICSSDLLANLDVALSNAFKMARTRAVVTGAQQRHWITLRDTVCHGMVSDLSGCLIDVMGERTNSLSSANGHNTHSPSFQCARAGTAVEREICKFGPLSYQDGALSAAYNWAQSRNRVDAAGQSNWIGNRELECSRLGGDALSLCVARMTAARIQFLNAL